MGARSFAILLVVLVLAVAGALTGITALSQPSSAAATGVGKAGAEPPMQPRLMPALPPAALPASPPAAARTPMESHSEGAAAPAAVSVQAAARLVIDLDPGWSFHIGDAVQPYLPACNDAHWPVVNLPHTWNALDGQDGGGNYVRCASWYRKHVQVPATCAGRELFLVFEGAFAVTTVYVNGSEIGRHAGGFSAFAFDATRALRAGEDNLIAVQVDNAWHDDLAPLRGGFTMCGGLYRDVSMVATAPLHLSLTDLGSPGVAIQGLDVSAAAATIAITARLRNDSDRERAAALHCDIIDATGVVVASAVQPCVAARGREAVVPVSIHLADPHLWDGRRDPYLYRTRVTVVDGAKAIDVVEQPLGLRSFHIDPAAGFILNGHHLDLHGVNFHQDRFNKGWAISPADQVEDVGMIAELGATFVRLSHYQHPRKTYDLLDAAGIIAWAEIPLTHMTTDSPAFTASCEQQLREMIRQTGNHPSVICWGLFNEIATLPPEIALVRRLVAVAHEEDPSRPTAGASLLPDEAALNHLTEVMGFNKYQGWFLPNCHLIGSWADAFHSAYPQRAAGLVEFGAGASINQHQLPPVQPLLVSNFFPHPEEYQSEFHEEVWKQLKVRPYLWCTSLWSMFDFAYDLASNTEVPGRCDLGLVTIDRKVKKDAFYWYQANWSERPMVHITSRRYYHRPPGPIEVKVYASLDQVGLTVNGEPQGAQTSTDHIFRFPVTLRSGANQVVATASGGGHSCTDRVSWEAP
jgi:beta-galactosidase